MTLVYEAMIFARKVHKDQVRKYTGNPYVDHLAEVAGIVSTVITHIGSGNAKMEDILATAWLHDCVEDCGVSIEEIDKRFGFMVALGVSGLSDLETGNRAERKQKSRDRLSLCSDWIQTIKCADLISNTSSIVKHDPKFAITYLEEKRLLLAVLNRADPYLHQLASEMSDHARL